MARFLLENLMSKNAARSREPVIEFLQLVACKQLVDSGGIRHHSRESLESIKKH